MNHRILLDKMSESIRKGKPLARRHVMRALGYSPSYSDSSRPTQTQSWNDLLDTFLPDSLLAEKHQKLLVKKEVVVRSSALGHEIVRTGEIDVAAVSKGLEMAYRIKKKNDDTHIIKFKFGELTDSEIEGEIASVLSEAIGLAEGEDTPLPE